MQQDKYCKHLPSLSRQTLKKLTESQPNEYCALHHSHPLYYLCLHCGQSCCLDYVGEITCLRYHFKDNPKHYFALEMQLGTIWCSQCQDSIQNMIFIASNATDENILKMNRFTKFITDIWRQVQGKVKVEKAVAVHRGLSNLGNTCFLNVVLQCLYASTSVKKLYESYQSKENKLKYNKRLIAKEVEYFYDDMIDKAESERWNVVSSKKTKPQSETHYLYRKEVKNADFNILFKAYLQSMSSQTHNPFNPQQLLNYLGMVNKKYLLTEEQDAEELLLLVIDLLSEGEKLYFLKEVDRYKEVEKILGFQKLSPIQQLFGFYLVNQIQCNQCKEINLSVNLSYNIGLALEQTSKEEYSITHKNQTVDIDYWEELKYPKNEGKCELLEPFFKVQRLNLSNNYYSCSKCKSLLAWRKHYIVSQPQILMVSVKRFNAKLQKNIVKVPIAKEVDLEGYCCSAGEKKYQLYGVIVHEGKTLSTGHYICFIALGDRWFLCSDHRVQVVNWKYVQDQQAYILLYQRKNVAKSD